MILSKNFIDKAVYKKLNFTREATTLSRLAPDFIRIESVLPWPGLRLSHQSLPQVLRHIRANRKQSQTTAFCNQQLLEIDYIRLFER